MKEMNTFAYDLKQMIRPVEKVILAYRSSDHYRENPAEYFESLKEASFWVHVIHSPKVARQLDEVIDEVVNIMCKGEMVLSFSDAMLKTNKNLVFFTDPFKKYWSLYDLNTVTYEEMWDCRKTEPCLNYFLFMQYVSKEIEKYKSLGLEIHRDEFFMHELRSAVLQRFHTILLENDLHDRNPKFIPEEYLL